MKQHSTLILALVMSSIMATACTKTYRSYSDDKVEAAAIAHLRSNFTYRGLPGFVDTATGVQILLFDNKVLPDSDYVTAIELLAGHHCATVAYTKDVGSVLGAIVLATGGVPGFYQHEGERMVLCFDAESGHNYEIKHHRISDSDQALDLYWIIDTADDQVMAGQPPDYSVDADDTSQPDSGDQE